MRQACALHCGGASLNRRRCAPGSVWSGGRSAPSLRGAGARASRCQCVRRPPACAQLLGWWRGKTQAAHQQQRGCSPGRGTPLGARGGLLSDESGIPFAVGRALRQVGGRGCCYRDAAGLRCRRLVLLFLGSEPLLPCDPLGSHSQVTTQLDQSSECRHVTGAERRVASRPRSSYIVATPTLLKPS